MKKTILNGVLCLLLACGVLLSSGCAGCAKNTPPSSDPEGSESASSAGAAESGASNMSQGETSMGLSSSASGNSGTTTRPNGNSSSPNSSGSPSTPGKVTTLPPIDPGKTSDLATVNVKDFGAKGDGKTDDTAAVQAAIDKVYGEGGGYVYLPSGTYPLNAVNIKTNVCLYSDRTWNPDDKNSRGNTVLIPKNASVSCVVNMRGEGDKNRNPVLMNVCIDGKNLGGGMAGVASLGATAVNGSSLRVENVRVMNCTGVGIDISYNAIASVRGCMVTGCGMGLKIVGWDQFIYNNVIAGNKGDGVHVAGGTAMNFCYNRVGWNDGCGIRFDGYGRVSMTGNTFDSNASPGVYFSGSSNMTLHDNLFIRNGWAPASGLQNGGCQISINASTGINVTDNELKAATDSLTSVKAPEYGIIGDVMTNCVIQGNAFTNAGTKGKLKTDDATNLECAVSV